MAENHLFISCQKPATGSMGNTKSTVVLSGSLVELLLIYLCERKRLRLLSIIIQKKHEKRKPKNCMIVTCLDWIIYTDENKLLGKDFPYLGHLLRVYRNLIHPGCELRQDQGIIDESKVEISFKGTIEILKRII
ncbi:MAG: hypothetical protein IPM81_02100 [Saprospirales bacterium]|nr:hypothetical protein [Saprospirales bacterium]